MEAKHQNPSLDCIKKLLQSKYDELIQELKSDWKVDSTKKGSTISIKKCEANNIKTKMIKAEKLINQPLEKIFKLIWCDTEAIKKYDSECAENVILRIEEAKYVIIYYKTKSHFYLNSTDYIFATTYFEDGNDIYIISASIDYALPLVKDTERYEILLGANILKYISKTETNFINILNLKDADKKSLVEYSAEGLAKNIESIEKYLEKNIPNDNLPIIGDIKSILAKYNK